MEIMATKNKLIIWIFLLTTIFSLSIAFDLSPYLRGPAPYPPDWRWSYLFINTFSKLWFPLTIAVSILFVVYITEEMQLKTIFKNKFIALIVLVLLSLLFQLSVIYFSRAGLGVLLHRIIDPNLNGYFTTSLHIKNITIFLKNYSQNVLSYSMHAQGHPPGAILFFYFINSIFKLLPSLNINTLNINHKDVDLIWKSLSVYQKETALFSSIFIPVLSSLVLIPLYFVGELLYGARAGLRASYLYIFVPSVVLFIPINDVFIPLISTTSFAIFLYALKRENNFYLALSTFIFSLGLFFSLSVLPLILIFLFFLFYYLYKKRISLKAVLYFVIGLLLLPFCLIVFGINSLDLVKVLLSGLPKGRKYTTWLFYDLYDFFIFSGIAYLLTFSLQITRILKVLFLKRKIKIDILLFSFTFMLFALDLSGSVRGEVARIWLPFYSFLVIIIAGFITNFLNFSKKQIIFFLLLQFMQIIVMQEFWVTLW